MIKKKKILTVEYTAIILLWTLVFISPLLFMDNSDQDWRGVHVMWIESAIVGIAFLVNRFLLMPFFFFSKQYARYIISLAMLFLLLSIFILYFDGVNIIVDLIRSNTLDGDSMQYMSEGVQRAAPRYGRPSHTRPDIILPIDSLLIDDSLRAMARPKMSVIPPMITVLVLAAIVIALDMGLSIAVKWVMSEQKQAEINKERIMAQLLNLQSQVSPHFFMNTLNNIHALVDIDSQRAKQTIIELSGLMDYLLYDTATKDKVSLQREIDFVNSYINLMRLRFSKQVRIDSICGENMPMVKIPPLLFLNFIENSFKYGVDYENESFIELSIHCIDDHLVMRAVNSNHSNLVKTGRHGLGISNSRKRLDLLYGESYTLDIKETEEIHSVTLTIPII